MKTKQLILSTTIFFMILGCVGNQNDITQQINDDIEKGQQIFVIERNIPGAGDLTPEELKAISQSSCGVIEELGTEKISWLHSYVTADKVYCVYQADDESLVREHAEKGGFPANNIAQVSVLINPGTAE